MSSSGSPHSLYRMSMCRARLACHRSCSGLRIQFVISSRLGLVGGWTARCSHRSRLSFETQRAPGHYNEVPRTAESALARAVSNRADVAPDAQAKALRGGDGAGPSREDVVHRIPRPTDDVSEWCLPARDDRSRRRARPPCAIVTAVRVAPATAGRRVTHWGTCAGNRLGITVAGADAPYSTGAIERTRSRSSSGARFAARSSATGVAPRGRAAGLVATAQVLEDSQDTTMVVLGRQEAELREDARGVRLHGLRRDEQSLRDGCVRSALGHQGENVSLPV